jgi:predicted RNase H-like HicB family nuclease
MKVRDVIRLSNMTGGADHASDFLHPKTLARIRKQSEMKYAVIYETGPEGGYRAYAPDLQGCVASARTLEEVRTLMEEAIEFHIDGMRVHGETVPEPSSLAEMLEVA